MPTKDDRLTNLSWKSLLRAQVAVARRLSADDIWKDHHGVPVAGEPQQLGQFWTGSVRAGSLVREDPLQNLAFELASLVLVQSAYSDVPGSAVRPLVASNLEPVRLSSSSSQKEVKTGHERLCPNCPRPAN